MNETRGMTNNARWSVALLIAAASVLAAGAVAWVFPREITAIAGPWALPTLSLSAALLALGLAFEWHVLRSLLLVLAITLVVGWNRSSMTSTSHFAGTCLGLLLMLVTGRVATTPRRLRLAMMAFLGGGMVTMVLGLAGTYVRKPTMGTVLTPTLSTKLPAIPLGLAGLGDGWVNTNALAAAVLLIAPVGIAVLVLGTREKADWLGLLPLAFVVAVTGAVTLVICSSRSAWMAIWLVLVSLLVWGMRSSISRIVIGLLIVAPLLVATTSVPFVSQEAFGTKALEFWQSAQDRAQIMTQGVEQWKTSPWFGIGLNDFRLVYQPQSADIAHAHNMVLQTALDVGAVGSAAYWGVIALLLVRAGQAARGSSRMVRSAAIGAALSLVGVSLFGLLDAVPLGSKIGIFQWMSGGLILAAWGITGADVYPSDLKTTSATSRA